MSVFGDEPVSYNEGGHPIGDDGLLMVQQAYGTTEGGHASTMRWITKTRAIRERKRNIKVAWFIISVIVLVVVTVVVISSQ